MSSLNDFDIPFTTKKPKQHRLQHIRKANLENEEKRRRVLRLLMIHQMEVSSEFPKSRMGK